MSFISFDKETGKPKRLEYNQTVLKYTPQNRTIESIKIKGTSNNETAKPVVNLSEVVIEQVELPKHFSDLLILLKCENNDEKIDTSQFNFAKLKNEAKSGYIRIDELIKLQCKLRDWLKSIDSAIQESHYNIDVMKKCFESLKIVIGYYKLINKPEYATEPNYIDLTPDFTELLGGTHTYYWLSKSYNKVFVKTLFKCETKEDVIPLYNTFKTVTLHKSILNDLNLDLEDKRVKLYKAYADANGLLDIKTFIKKLAQLLKMLFGIENKSNYSEIKQIDLCIQDDTDLFVCDIIDGCFLNENLINFSSNDCIDISEKFFTQLMKKVGYVSSRFNSEMRSSIMRTLRGIMGSQADAAAKIAIVENVHHFLNSIPELADDQIFDLSEQQNEIIWHMICEHFEEGDVEYMKMEFAKHYVYCDDTSNLMLSIFCKYEKLFIEWLRKPKDADDIKTIIQSYEALTKFFDADQNSRLDILQKRAQKLFVPISLSSLYEIKLTEKDDTIYDRKSVKMKLPKEVKTELTKLKKKAKKEKKDISFNGSYTFVEIDFNTDYRTYRIECNAYHAAILIALSENDDDLPFNTLKEITGIETKALHQCITDIVKVSLLECRSTCDDDDDNLEHLTITLNYGYEEDSEIIKIEDNTDQDYSKYDLCLA